MSHTRWHGSPLAATAGILAGLALLAIPLRGLTGRTQPVAAAALPVAADQTTPAVLRMKVLDRMERLAIRTTDGRVLFETAGLPAGESEHDAEIPMDHGVCELVLTAEAGERETAVFLTVMPDGFPVETRYVTGSGALDETLRFEWHIH
jgi:hypothetical protein